MSREGEIRIIAYGLWEKEGHPEGKDTSHWFKATQIWEEQHQPKSILPGPPSSVSQNKPAKKSRPAGRG
jgi:hypothetical protein